MDARNAVVLGGREPNWYAFAMGYRAAGDLLVGHLRSDRVVSEHVCLPILFLYRHYIELTLKGLLLDMGEFTEAVEPVSPHHPLAPLWTKTTEHIVEIRLPHSPAWMGTIGGWILEFDQLDPRSFAFRYPVTTKGHPSAAVGREVDMAHVHAVVQRIGDTLDECRTMIEKYLHISRELAQEGVFDFYHS